MKRFLLSTFFFNLLFSSIQLFGQSYTLTGKIIDAGTNEPLIGATLRVLPNGSGVATDSDGKFLITGITEKNVELEAAYLGYESQTFSFQFEKRSEYRTIRLQASSYSLNEVVVTGIAEGQIQAMIDQKRAESIKNIISAEQILTFPDLNAAEVLQRIPGITLQRDQGEGRFVQLRGTPPELTNFNINGEQIPSPEGNVRYVGLDIVPSDQIERVEVTKVLTPDMDADGIGGSVNIKTKDALTEKPQIGATLAAGYNNLRQTPNGQLQFSYGQRYGKFGFQINSSFYRNNQGSDNIEYKFAKGPFFGEVSQEEGVLNYHVQYREAQLRHYDITRTRISVSPTLDLKLNDQHRFYIRGMYNSFEDDEVRRRKIYDLDDALSETYYLYGGIEHDVRDRVKIQELSTLALGGEHNFGGIELDYQLFLASANEKEPNTIESLFDSPGQAIAIRLDFTDPDYPVATFPREDNAGNATDYDNYEMNELRFESSRVKDFNLTPRVNLKIPYNLGNNQNGYLKFGGKIRYKEKQRDILSQVYGAYFQTSNIYPGEGPKLSLATVNDGFRDDNLLNQGYLLEYMPSPELLRDFFEFYPQFFIYHRTATKTATYGEDYTANETIYAGYGMFRHNIGRLMVLGGLRFERTDIDYQGINILLNNNRFVGLDTLTDKRSHTFLLPQIQAKFSINEDFNIRGALTYTYSRPNFEDVLPYREENRDDVKYGNPDLKYPRSMNVDLLAEKYFGKGILSGGIFYKKIDDFIFFFKRFAHEGDPKDYGLVEITKAINGNEAFVYGAELQAQFKFDFLPGFLQNFGLYSNYTYTYSEAFINRRYPANYTSAVVVFGEDDLSAFTDLDETEKLTLPGQAQHTGNLALFYETKKLFVRASMNYQDDFLYRIGADADLDEYYDKSLRLDITGNFQISPSVNIFTDWINVTNTPLRYYLGPEQRIKQQEFYSWWNRIGLRIKI